MPLLALKIALIVVASVTTLFAAFAFFNERQQQQSYHDANQHNEQYRSHRKEKTDDKFQYKFDSISKLMAMGFNREEALEAFEKTLNLEEAFELLVSKPQDSQTELIEKKASAADIQKEKDQIYERLKTLQKMEDSIEMESKPEEDVPSLLNLALVPDSSAMTFTPSIESENVEAEAYCLESLAASSDYQASLTVVDPAEVSTEAQPDEVSENVPLSSASDSWDALSDESLNEHLSTLYIIQTKELVMSITQQDLETIEEQLESLIKTTSLPHQTESLLHDFASHPIPVSLQKYPATHTLPLKKKLAVLQAYISSLEYNHITDPFWVVRKTYSVNRLHKMAQEMMTQSLPIKCLEAVVLAIWLTNGMDQDRISTRCLTIALAFKSSCDDKIYRHIVLVVKTGDSWGALGLSRRSDLMGKPMGFTSLLDLVRDYDRCYQTNSHKLVKIKLGLPVTHHRHSNEPIVWKHTSIVIQSRGWTDIAKDIDGYLRAIRNFPK